ncbi:MAG: alpha/beta fold hydrolase [Kofleriaceae bacterium]
MRALVVVLLVAACGGGDPNTGDDDDTAIDAAVSPPVASGCITEVGTGDHVLTCSGLQVDIRIPAACQAPGCGLILVLHGDTGSGLLMDGHVKLRERGEAAGYIVVAPTGPPFGQGFPGSTWEAENDAMLIDLVEQTRDVFRVDPRRIHVTGFSRGGFVTWRLLCDHSDLFASAAPAGAGNGQNFGEATCFSQNRKPARKLPILFMLGRTDASVGYASMTNIRDAAVADYGATGPVNLAMDASFRHDRFTGPSGVIEVFDHAYETVANGPFGSAAGHCIAGSTTDPFAPQYAIPCVLPNSFVWGEEIVKFFQANPMP